MVLLKVVRPLKFPQHTKCHGPTFTGTSFASTSAVRTSAILEWLMLWDWKVWRRSHLQWHNLPTELHKHLPAEDESILGRAVLLYCKGLTVIKVEKVYPV
jgi:hypothetical protein